MLGMKNELGKQYGIWEVEREYKDRTPSNHTVRWVCKCLNCGHRVVRSGNNLRFGRYGKCGKCGRRV